MAKRTFTTRGINFTAVADGVLTSGLYMAVKAQLGPPVQLVDVLEVLVSGVANNSQPGGFCLKRASTNETGTITALAAPNSDGLMLPTGTALASLVSTFIAAGTTQPTASTATTDATLQLGVNAFGGILRWNAAPGQEWKIQANAASPGAPGIESVFYNSLTGGGTNAQANVHIIYEPY